MNPSIDLKTLLFDYTYGAALNDAIGQKAFEGNKIPLRKNDEAKGIAKGYIDALLNGDEPDFDKTTQELEKSFNTYIEAHWDEIAYMDKQGNQSNPVFRFGNAQKLLNMLTKNVFFLVYRDEALRARFANCHCPMDGRMMETVKKELSAAAKAGDQDAKALLAQYKKSATSAWSRIERADKNQYDHFQKCIAFLAGKETLYPAGKETLSPIEYDYWMWKQTEEKAKAQPKKQTT